LTIIRDRTTMVKTVTYEEGPMILITIKMQIRPDKMDEWLALADSYAKDVNAEEGCLFFQFSRSLNDANEFICLEGFKDADAGGAHVKNSHVKRFFEAAPDLVAAQPQIIYIDTPHDGFGPMGEIQPR
jgi:quinol monooxygenase YgiN